ncbi:hypothetical protein D3C84_1002720 [compost metagenome]
MMANKMTSDTGPIMRPSTPNSFRPTNMAMSVGSGSRPTLLASTLGSIICLVMRMTPYRIDRPIPSCMSP